MESLGDILRRGGWQTTPPGSRPVARRGNRSLATPSYPASDACPHCHGVGFLYPPLSEFDPDYGKAVACVCTERELEMDRLQRLQRYSNLGPLVEMTFDSTSRLGRSEVQANQDQFARVLDSAQSYASDPQGWFVLTGSSGSGKTRIAAAIANAAIARGQPAFFVVVPDLLDHLRGTFGPQSTATYDQLFEQVRDAPLLVLDDLGAHSTTPWAQEKLFQILNHRYSGQMPTVITVSGSLDAMDGRLRHRLTDPALVELWGLEEFEDVLFQYQGALPPQLLQTMTFDNFDPEQSDAAPIQRESLRTAKRAAIDFAQRPSGWLMLTGPVGCGKTHLAAAVANHRVRSAEPVFFVVVPDLLDHLRATYAPQSTVAYDTLFDTIKNTSLLILDDLGSHTASPWAAEKLFQLINYRYIARLPTVITTALDGAQMADISPAIASRLWDQRVTNIIPMDAPDFRAGAQASGSGRRRGPRGGRRF